MINDEELLIVNQDEDQDGCGDHSCPICHPEDDDDEEYDSDWDSWDEDDCDCDFCLGLIDEDEESDIEF